MKVNIETIDLSCAFEPDELLLRDGTRFTRTVTGAFGGDPTPVQVGEIQGRFSDHSRIGLVRTRKVGEGVEFEIGYFLRET